jgi:hypothetical protein
LQRSVRDEASIPVEFALDLDGRKAGRKRSACHHVLGSDRMRFIVEIDEIASAHVHCADAQAHLARIDAVEIDQPLERALQEFGFVKARGFRGAVRVKPGSRLPKGKKARGTRCDCAACAKLVEERAREVAFWSEGMGSGSPVKQRIGGDLLPKGAQLPDPLARFVSCDDG